MISAKTSVDMWPGGRLNRAATVDDLQTALQWQKTFLAHSKAIGNTVGADAARDNIRTIKAELKTRGAL